MKHLAPSSCALAFALVFAACASTPLGTLPLRRSLPALSEAASLRFPDPDHAASARADFALTARLDEARGDLATALRRWWSLLDDPTWGPWALARALPLLDRAPLPPDALSRARRVPQAAPLVEAIAIRINDKLSAKYAHIALHTSFTYRASGRLVPYPGPTRAVPPPTTWPPPRDATLGLIASPEEGPGVYAFSITFPPSSTPTLLTVATDSEATLTFPPSFATAPLTHPAFTHYLPPRFTAPLPASSTPFTLTLLLTTASAQATARLTQTLPGSPTPPPPHHLASLLARLDAAIAARDLDLQQDLLALLPPGPLADLLSGHVAQADPTLPDDFARATAQAAWQRALDADPDLTEARLELATLAREADDLARATELLAPLLPSTSSTSSTSSASPPPRAPLPDALALLLHTDPHAARSAAHALTTALPHSCLAWDLALTAALPTLRFDLADAPALLGAPFMQIAAPPGPCQSTQLRVLKALSDVGQLPTGSPLLAALTPSDPGPARARFDLLQARLALRDGDAETAQRHATRALAAGGEDTLAASLLARATRLLAPPDAPAPDRPASEVLPLTDPRPLLAARSRAPAAHSVTTLLSDTLLVVHPDGAITERHHRLVLLHDLAAVPTYGELAIPDDAELILARTWKLTGPRPIPQEPETIIEKDTISFPNLAINDAVEWAWTRTRLPDPLIAPGWRIDPLALDDAAGPTVASNLTLIIEKSAETPIFTLDSRLPPPSHPAPNRWLFALRDLPRVPDEPGDPAPLLRRRTFAAASPHAFERHAAAQAAQIPTRIRSSPTLRAALAAATATLPEAASTEPLLRALYRYVLDTIEESPTSPPFSGDATAALIERTGSRALVLAALCREAGLTCTPALLHPLWDGPLGLVLTPSSFYYPVLRGPPGSDGLGAVWLDPSSRFAPYGPLPPALQGAPALALTPSGPPQRATTPVLPVARWGSRAIALALTLAPDGRSLEITASETIDGLFGASWRTAITTIPAVNRPKLLEHVIHQAFPEADVHATTLHDLDRPDAPLGFSWQATLPTRGTPTLRTFRFQLFPESISRDTVALPTRETTLVVNQAIHLTLDLTLTAPPGWSLAAAPSATTLQWPPDAADPDLRVDLQAHPGASPEAPLLTLKKRLVLRPTWVSPELYPAWVRAAQRADQADQVTLTLQQH